jgi:hypothetical protein
METKTNRNHNLMNREVLHTTLGFMQVGLDIVIPQVRDKSKLRFGQTNNYQLLYITSTIYF